jgi:hypothetical protein
VPGLAPAVQPTQLAMFGAASSAAGGGAAFDLVLGGSPMFLLLDAGASVGAVEAGRFGLLGQGAGAFLVGAIGGVGGEAAARLAGITGGGAAYLFNTCPMGAGCGGTGGGEGGNAGGGTGGGSSGGGTGNGGGIAGGAGPNTGNGPNAGSGPSAGNGPSGGGGTAPASSSVLPVPVRAGLFTLDPQGQMPGLPHPTGTPFAWWLAPLPWPFEPLVAEEPNRR